MSNNLQGTLLTQKSEEQKRMALKKNKQKTPLALSKRERRKCIHYAYMWVKCFWIDIHETGHHGWYWEEKLRG